MGFIEIFSLSFSHPHTSAPQGICLFEIWSLADLELAIQNRLVLNS